MRSKKQLLLLLFLLLFIGFAGFIMHKASRQLGTLQFGASIAHAEDDEEDDEDDEEKDGEEDDEDDSENKSSSTTYTYTIPGQVVTSYVLRDVTLPDSDFDGLPDSDDPHPAIAEIYIVEDADRDGIVDQFDLPE